MKMFGRGKPEKIEISENAKRLTNRQMERIRRILTRQGDVIVSGAELERLRQNAKGAGELEAGEVRRLQSQLEELNRMYRGLEAEARGLRERPPIEMYNALNADMRSLQEEKDRLETELARRGEGHAREYRDLQVRLGVAQAETDRLRALVSGLRGKPDIEKYRVLERELQERKRRIETLEAEMERLRRRPTSEMYHALEARLGEIKEEKGRSEAVISGFREMLSDGIYHALQARLENLGSEELEERSKLEAVISGLGKMSIQEMYYALQEYLRGLETGIRKLRGRPTEEMYRALQEQVADLTSQVEKGLKSLFLVEISYSILQLAQSREQEGIIEQLQQELAATRDESRRRGTIIGNILKYVSRHEKPPVGSTVAICGRDVGSTIASAQLMRTGMEVGYATEESWYEWLPMLNKPEIRRNLDKQNKAQEIIIIGLYPAEGRARKNLQSLSMNGAHVVLITDKEIPAPDLVSVYSGSSLPRALSEYLRTEGRCDEIIERLAHLGDACKNGDTEEACYLRDAFYDLTDTSFRTGVARQLSKKGTVVRSDMYDGIVRRAEDYRGLRRDGFLN